MNSDNMETGAIPAEISPDPAAPTQHPPEALLIDHATGALSGAESVLIAAHLASCDICRLTVQACDAIGGAMLDALAPAFLPPDLLDRTLAAIDAAPLSQEPQPRDMVADALRSPRWRRFPGGFGIQTVHCNGAGADIIVLLRAAAGKAVLPHRHVGEEWTVVLQGGFSDHTGHYRRGDFIALDGGVEHRPKADKGETCICLILMRAMPIYTSLPGKLLSPLLKL